MDKLNALERKINDATEDLEIQMVEKRKEFIRNYKYLLSTNVR